MDPAEYPSPALHDATVHGVHVNGEVGANSLNFPHGHVEHVESVAASPAVKLSPERHDDTVWATHALRSSLFENVPAAHGVHDASAAKVPATKPFPAAHRVIEYGLHPVASMLDDHCPLHTSQRASRSAVPLIKP